MGWIGQLKGLDRAFFMRIDFGLFRGIKRPVSGNAFGPSSQSCAYSQPNREEEPPLPTYTVWVQVLICHRSVCSIPRKTNGIAQCSSARQPFIGQPAGLPLTNFGKQLGDESAGPARLGYFQRKSKICQLGTNTIISCCQGKAPLKAPLAKTVCTSA